MYFLSNVDQLSTCRRWHFQPTYSALNPPKPQKSSFQLTGIMDPTVYYQNLTVSHYKFQLKKGMKNYKKTLYKVPYLPYQKQLP
jgi:hypothetical protein